MHDIVQTPSGQENLRSFPCIFHVRKWNAVFQKGPHRGRKGLGAVGEALDAGSVFRTPQCDIPLPQSKNQGQNQSKITAAASVHGADLRDDLFSFSISAEFNLY